MEQMLSNNKLTKKLNYIWRFGATGFSFISFGIGGIAIGGIVAPLVKMSTADTRKRQEIAQKAIRFSFQSFTQMLVKLGVMTYEVDGLEKLVNSRQELVIANHPTLIDVVILIGLMEKANCIVKKALWTNPFTLGPVRSAGYILNEGSEQFIQNCVKKLKERDAASLLIFPEGTRTEKDALLNTFQRGAANIAIRANVPIRPILIKCTPSTLTKNEKWYHVPQERFHIQIKVLDALYIENVLDDTTVSSKQVKQLNQFLHNLFNQELSINEQLS